MKVCQRKCLVDHTLKDPDTGEEYQMVKGKVYTTKKKIKYNQITFMSTVWAKVPRSWFEEN